MRLPQNLARTVDKIARDAVGADWGMYAGLLDHWSEIVGPDYAKETTPVKVAFPRGKKTDEKWANGKRSGGTLTISLPQGLTLEMSHRTESIRSRINSFFGHDAIEKIAFKPYYPKHDKPLSAEPRPLSVAERAFIKDGTESIENNELKEALQQLGASVLANQKKL